MSNMITYQFSPVEARNSVIMAKPKLEKLLYFVTVFPLVTDLNKNTPNTEYIKKTKNNNAPMLSKEGSEYINVSISFYSPLIDLIYIKFIKIKCYKFH